MPTRRTAKVQLKLRFTDTLRRKLARAARKSEQSLNSEIVQRLEDSLQKNLHDDRQQYALDEVCYKITQMTEALSRDIKARLNDIPCVKSRVNNQLQELTTSLP